MYQVISHLLYQYEEFCRKDRYTAEVNMTEAPTALAYTIIVSRESVRITIALFDLYDIIVKTADIINMYLIASVYERK